MSHLNWKSYSMEQIRFWWVTTSHGTSSCSVRSSLSISYWSNSINVSECIKLNEIEKAKIYGISDSIVAVLSIGECHGIDFKKKEHFDFN